MRREFLVTLVAVTVALASAGHGSAEEYMTFVVHSAGRNGTEWRSDLSVLNASSFDATITLTFRAPGGDVVRHSELLINDGVQWTDAVVSLFGVDGDAAGAVLVTANTALVVTHYCYTSSGSGTVGQTFPAAELADTLERGHDGFLSALRNTDGYRTNVGFVNFSDTDADVTLVLRDAHAPIGGMAFARVPAGRWVQLNDIFAVASAGTATFASARLQVHNSGARIWAYGSIVDNHTGDPATVLLVP